MGGKHTQCSGITTQNRYCDACEGLSSHTKCACQLCEAAAADRLEWVCHPSTSALTDATGRAAGREPSTRTELITELNTSLNESHELDWGTTKRSSIR